MSLTAALLIFAQSAAPQVAEVTVVNSNAVARPIAVQARASVRIIRPALIEFSLIKEGAGKAGDSSFRDPSFRDPSAREMQRTRDDAGTYWAEFS